MRLAGPLFVATLVLGTACGGEPDEGTSRKPNLVVSSGSGGGSAQTGAGAAGGGTEDGGAGTGGEGGSAPDVPSPFGAVDVVTIADTPCAAPQGVAAPIDTPAYAPYFDAIATVAGRLVLSSRYDATFYTADLDGSNAGEAPATNDYADVASSGSSLALLSVSGGKLTVEPRSEHGSPLGPHVVVAVSGQVAYDIAGGDGESLVVWGSDGALHARGISDDEIAPAFDIEADAYASELFVSATRAAAGFAVAWTGKTGSTYRTAFALVSADGLEAPVVELLSTDTPHQVVRLVSTESGFALLVAADHPDVDAALLRLDASGAVAGPARALEGVRFGWDIAARGDDVAVIALRETLEPELRTFDATLAPTSSWTCLDGPGDLAYLGAIAGSDAGWTVVYRTPTEVEMLLQVPGGT